MNPEYDTQPSGAQVAPAGFAPGQRVMVVGGPLNGWHGSISRRWQSMFSHESAVVFPADGMERASDQPQYIENTKLKAV